MSRTPAAEVSVDAALVRRLLAEQHPDLAGEVRMAGHGWDNEVARLGNALAVRLPRRASAVPLLKHEQCWLPELAPRLPLSVPAPVRIGAPSPTFRWPWSVVPWFDGVPVAEVSPAERGAMAAPLAEFLAALHAPAPPEAPANPVRGVPLAGRDGAFHERSAMLPDGPAFSRLWDRIQATAPWTGPPLWLHGDPHPANLVANRPARDVAGVRRLVAVVDFGDMTAGDPASDLATAWLTFDSAGRAAFRARYDALTGCDAATWDRALGWALYVTAVLLAQCDDAPLLRAIGEHGRAQVFTELP